MLKGHASLERLLGRSGARKRARPKDSSRRNKKRRADGGFQRDGEDYEAENENAAPVSPLIIDDDGPQLISDVFPDDRADVNEKKICRIEIATSLPQDPAKSENSGQVVLDTYLAGWRFHGGMRCSKGQKVHYFREETNKADPNAIQVVINKNHSNADVLGYLPARVSKELAPLLDAGILVLEGSVKGPEGNSSTSCGLSIQMIPNPAEDLEIQRKVSAALAKVSTPQPVDDTVSSISSGASIIKNFSDVLDFVVQHDARVLGDPELQFSTKFHSLSSSAQFLFLRLFLRKGPWFRVDILHYVEVHDPARVIQELLDANLFLDHRGLSFETALAIQLSVLRVSELKELSSELGVKTNKNQKQGIVNVLKKEICERSKKGDDIIDKIHQIVGTVVQLCPEVVVVVKRFQRLYFLNEYSSISDFTAAQAGALRWPKFSILIKQPVFESREALLDYEEAVKDAEHLANALDDEDYATAEMATVGVALLEKQKKYREANEKLLCLLGGNCCPSRRGYWWNRLTTNLEKHLHRVQEALEFCEAGLADDWVRHGERFSMQRRLLRLGKPPRRWKTPSWAKQVLSEPRIIQISKTPIKGTVGKNRFIGLDNTSVTVEELALQFYMLPERGGWMGCHSENGIWHILFGLVMWDVIFSGVEDVFRTPFQSSPLDLSTDAFYPTRKQAIDIQLEALKRGEAPSILRKVWQDHHGELCKGVNWSRHSLNELLEIVECIGGKGIAAVCQLLVEDYGGWSGGFPDLLLWNPKSKTAKLSEVKGPRDRLSDQQRALILALTGAGLDIEIFKVSDK